VNQEAVWLQSAIEGNEEAFGNLIESYQTRVYNLCYRMLGSIEEAEDAAQETFWRAFQNMKRYDPTRSFPTWLLSIAAHYCIDKQRRKRLPSFDLDGLTEEIIPDSSPTPEKVACQTEEHRQLHQLVDKLGPQDRAALIMRYWYDFSDDEIAQALSLSVSAVKSRLFRTRRQLAENWQATQPETIKIGGLHHESPAF
jgi:RNA polymerase sigma-70 factor (ECF subfamily)